MLIDDLIEKQKQYKAELAEAARTFKEKLTDKSIPLSERWDLFRKLSSIEDVLESQKWVCHSIDFMDLEWYEDFYYDRHEYVAYADLTVVFEDLVDAGKIRPDQYDMWREDILAKGNRGFTYDW